MPRETLSLEDRKQLLAMKQFDYGHVVIKVLQVLDAAEHELITQAEKQLEKRVAELREDRDHYKERTLHAEKPGKTPYQWNMKANSLVRVMREAAK